MVLMLPRENRGVKIFLMGSSTSLIWVLFNVIASAVKG